VRKPNQAAQTNLDQCASEYARAAEAHEKRADLYQRFAIALREGDMQTALALRQEASTIDIAAMLHAGDAFAVAASFADPEWWQEVQALKVQKPAINETVDIDLGAFPPKIALMVHQMICPKGEDCDTCRELKRLVDQGRK
jgi:hypothetical protein